jgi:hypothetical protein
MFRKNGTALRLSRGGQVYTGRRQRCRPFEPTNTTFSCVIPAVQRSVEDYSIGLRAELLALVGQGAER